ncbi:hypothetical protein GCM10010394_23940 [Streptomyces crystallinus]|uniref:Alpha/beta hydrolase n=2 Tax=Streptomyces crystallinus TaxID=68191 RepID=A0ABP3QT68_9ACTN
MRPLMAAGCVVLAQEHAQEMADRRAGQAQLAVLPAGHVVHHDAPDRFADVVRTFLSRQLMR